MPAKRAAVSSGVEPAQKRKKTAAQPEMDKALGAVDEITAECSMPLSVVRETAAQKQKKLISKKIHDNFKGPKWSNFILHEKVVDGMKLEGHIKARLDAKLSTGMLFFNGLKDKFGEAPPPQTVLTVRDNSQKVPEELEAAMEAIAADSKDVGLFDQWFELAPKLPNQRCACICARQLQQLPPLGNKRYEALWLNALKYFARTGFHREFPDEWAACKKGCDVVLSRCYLPYKAENVPVLSWWTSHKTFAALILEAADLDALCALPKKADLLAHKEMICRVYNGSETGAVVFSNTFTKLSTLGVSAACDAVLQTLFAKDITRETFAAARATFNAEVGALGIPALKAMKPFTCDVNYRGHTRKVTASAPMEEFSFKQAAMLYGTAVATQQMDPILCENDLLKGAAFEVNKIKIDPELLDAAKAARNMAIEIANVREIENGSCKGVCVGGVYPRYNGVSSVGRGGWGVRVRG